MIRRIMSSMLIVLGLTLFSGAGVIASAATTSTTISQTPPYVGP